MQQNDLQLWRAEAAELVQAYRERGAYTLQADPLQELEAFGAVFDHFVTAGRLPNEARLENKVDGIAGKLDQVIERTGDATAVVIPKAPTPIPQQRKGGLVGREDEIAWLRERLTGSGTAALAGVRGIGGIGKTALAIAIASELRDAFPGGVIWLECGPHAVEGVQDQLAAHLGIQLQTGHDSKLRYHALHAALSNWPQVLVVLDDVRRSHRDALDNLRPPQPHALLVTSRRDDVLPYSAQKRVDELSDTTARALLAEEIGDGQLAPANEAILVAILEMLENVPLAVILAGRWVLRVLDRQHPPAEPLGALRAVLQERRTQVLDQHPTDKNLSLRVTFGISYDDLAETDQFRVRQLGIFARNRFDLFGLMTVWQDDESEARQAIQRLENAGLLQAWDDDMWWLHDVLRDYASAYLAECGEQG